MNRIFIAATCCLSFALSCVAQNPVSSIQALKSSYSASGNIVAVDAQTILIEPRMPAPLCAMPRTEAGRISWSYYAFPLASITVPLTAVDETPSPRTPSLRILRRQKTISQAMWATPRWLSLREYRTAVSHHHLRSRQAGAPRPRSALVSGVRAGPRRHRGIWSHVSHRASARAFEMALRDAVLRAKARASRQ